EIAARVGIRKASLFHHFRSKDEIFIAIVLRSIDAAFAAIEPVLLAGLPPRERLQQAVFVHTREACSRREENLVLLHQSPAVSGDRVARAAGPRLREYEKIFESLLIEGIDSGDFRRVAPRLAARSILGLCNATIRWFSPDGSLSADYVAA